MYVGQQQLPVPGSSTLQYFKDIIQIFGPYHDDSRPDKCISVSQCTHNNYLYNNVCDKVNVPKLCRRPIRMI